MSSLEILICVVLVAVSAVMSSSEVAIFSLSRFQLRYLKENFRNSHRHIKRLLADPGGLLISILVINEIVNIAISSIIAGAVARARAGSHDETLLGVPGWAAEIVIGVALTAPIVLLFCEVTPKIIGARANQLVATLSARMLAAVYDASLPIRYVLKRLVLAASRITRGDDSDHPATSSVLRESDFLLMLEEGHREGAVHESELGLIKNVFDLDNTTVAEVFTPIHQVQTLPMTTTVRQALTLMRANRYSRIPITGANRRQVVGVLYSKDLLAAKLDPTLLAQTVDAFMRNPSFVGPKVRLNALFRKFKQQKFHLAVVQSQAGDVLGVVTMNDVLEALFDDLVPDDDASDVTTPAVRASTTSKTVRSGKP